MQLGEPSKTEATKEKDWIAIRLTDSTGQVQAGELYVVEAPGGEIIRGFLDRKGYCRISGLEKGTYRISFPDLQGLECLVER